LARARLFHVLILEVPDIFHYTRPAGIGNAPASSPAH
jgi:hypothetical protein